ncbi:MAG: hypothetical protein WC249_01655 [Patescibacteria group bacterium]|jgi:hypothetical protein
MKKLRKFLVVGVMVLSVIAMSGLAVAPSAKASASAGDLIKMSGLSSVYYLGADGKRYVFPNSATYFSWYPDFSGVVTIPASELQSYPLGGNVTMRAGTKLVKITTDPSVYAVTPNGVLSKIGSEAQASALYGTDWAKRVVDVPDAFFTNYTIGAALANGSVPAGSLVKNASSPAVYYYDGTNYLSISSESVFNSNRFDWANVVAVSSTITAGGTAVTGSQFVNVAQNGGNGSTPVTGSGLMVSLNASTPGALSVPNNGARVPMAKVNLTAANDGAITVNSITVKRIGLSTYSNISKVWAEQDGVIVASKKSMNSNDESILTFSPALTINAGQTVTLDLLVSLNSASGNVGLSIATASAVSATSASVSGSFPINGNLMSPTTYSVVNLYIASTTVSTTVKVGDEKVELGKFEVGFNNYSGGIAKDVVLTSIMLKNNGTEDLSKATMNLFLEQAGNKVSSSYTIDGRWVTFYFPGTGLNLLKDDSSKIFSIKGDVIAKENTGDSFVFTLNKGTDLVAYEKSTGFGANVYNTISGNTAADSYAISTITIDAGAVSVSKKSTSPSDTTIVKGSDNVVLLANVRADEAITADGLNLLYSDDATTTNQFENVRVYLNGLLLDSFDPSATTTDTSIAIDSTLTLNKGDNEVKVMAKAKTTAVASSHFQVKLGSTIFNSMNPEYVVSGNPVTVAVGGTATGGIFTVQGATLETVKNDGYTDGKTIVKGSTDVSLAKFNVKATNDVVHVTSISFGDNLGTVLSTSISDMKLYVDGSPVGNTTDFGSSGVNFSSLNFDIAKDSTKAIELKGSFDSSATGTFQTLMTISAQDSRGTSINSGNVATTTSFTVADAGTLNVALGGNTPAAGMLAAKSAEQEVAQFKFTAINDSASLTELNVVNTAIDATTATSTSATSSADARIASVKLYDGTTLIDSFVPVSGAGKFTITNDKVKVLANQSKTLSIKVVLNSIDNQASETNKDIHLGITTLKFKSSAGTETTQNSNGATGILANNFRVRKTVPTVALLALPTTVLTAGEQVISKFTVTADASGDVELHQIALDTSNTASATITALATSSTLKVNGSYKDVTVSTSSNRLIITFATTTNEIVSAGSSKTFEILASLSVAGSGSESVTSKISEDTDYTVGATSNFVWSDGASIETQTYSTGYRVSGLSTATQVISK